MEKLKRAFFYLLLLLGVLLILGTMASLLYSVDQWYIKVLDSPREQFFIACILCLILLLFYASRRVVSYWLLLLGLVISAALQGYIIAPYTSLVAKSVEDAAPSATMKQEKFSVLLANVLMKNRQAEELLEIIHAADPDIILAMETNKWWTDQLAVLSHTYPHRVIYPLDNTYGMALYSKFPLQGTDIRFLNYEDVPSIHTTVLLPNEALFNLHAMHPVPPVPSKLPGSIHKEEVALLKVGEMVAGAERPVLVAGDLNDVAWSKTSQLFGIKSGLEDVRVGRWFYNSFSAHSPILRWPLDHVYVSEEFRVVEMKQLPEFGSDHFPIYVSLTLERD